MKVPAILLKADFYSKGRNVRWIKDHGGEAVVILQAVWIASSQERGCKILKTDAYNIPFLMAFPDKKVIKVLESAVEVGLLDGDSTHYWNSQIVEDSEKFQEKHNNYKNGRKKREQIHPESCQNSPRILRESTQDYIDTDTDTEDESDTDHKLEIAIPEFREIKVANAIGRWNSHRRAIGKPFDQMALDSLVNLYAGRANELADDIDHSISNGWKTLNAKDRQQARAGPNRLKTHQSAVQDGLDLVAKFEREENEQERNG